MKVAALSWVATKNFQNERNVRPEQHHLVLQSQVCGRKKPANNNVTPIKQVQSSAIVLEEKVESNAGSSSRSEVGKTTFHQRLVSVLSRLFSVSSIPGQRDVDELIRQQHKDAGNVQDQSEDNETQNC